MTVVVPEPAVDPRAPGTRTAFGPRRRAARISGWGWFATSTALLILGSLMAGFLLDVVVIGGLRHTRDRQIGYATLRAELADQTASIGGAYLPATDGGAPVPVKLGDPVALLRIDGLGIAEVVRMGTDSGTLMSGPGLLPNTRLPGEPGASFILGRRTLYGGPFRDLHQIEGNAKIVVTSGVGTAVFREVCACHKGDAIPDSVQKASSFLELVTADGNPFGPSDALHVYAVLDEAATRDANHGQLPQRGYPPIATVPAGSPDAVLAGDSSAWIPLVLWGQALALAAFAATWLRRRWNPIQAWLPSAPVLLALGLTVADQAARLLPNVM